MGVSSQTGLFGRSIVDRPRLHTSTNAESGAQRQENVVDDSVETAPAPGHTIQGSWDFESPLQAIQAEVARVCQDSGRHNEEQRPIRVLVWNELAILVEALARALPEDSQIEIIEEGAASSRLRSQPSLLLSCVERCEPDIVIVNCTRGDAEWSDEISQVRIAFPAVKVVVVVNSLDPVTLRPYINARAVGCVTADAPLSGFVRAIHRVHAGEILFPSNVLMHLLTQDDSPSQPEPVSPPVTLLGARELEVLETLAAGLSTEEAAERLSITVHTVRTHTKNVLVKLHAHSKLEAVMIALRNGLIRLPD